MRQDTGSEVPARLCLARDYGQLEAMGDWLQRLARDRGLSERALFSLDLVLTEAVTNVLEHAQGGDPDAAIELRLDLGPDQIAIQVIDPGPPFDPTARAAMAPPASLAEATPGGLGIRLMRHYASHMEYRREAGHNILSLTLPNAPA